MGYESGALKYLLKALLYPIPYYIFGGTLLWILDVIDLIGSDSAQDLAINYILIHYGIPWPLDRALIQLVVGAVAATLLWYGAVRRR
jgi:hypothetical protein